MSQNRIHVSVGVLINKDDQVLISRRSKHVHQGNLWEFPGGKQSQGEDSKTALYREIFEELGLQILNARHFIKLHYDYPGQPVTLNVWLVTEWNGIPQSKEGQALKWMHKSELSGVDFPAANEKIISALQLPRLYLISPGPLGNIDDFYSGIENCINAGAELLQIRCKEKILINNPDIIATVLSICRKKNVRLLLNSSPATAIACNVDGVHLNSARLLQLNERPLNKKYLVAASCHNQNELYHAASLGLDFAVLSPVKNTPSHPDAGPLGWEKFSQLAANSDIPVYALGGMQPGDLRTAWDYGAHGIAMLSAVWSSAKPEEAVKNCYL